MKSPIKNLKIEKLVLSLYERWADFLNTPNLNGSPMRLGVPRELQPRCYRYRRYWGPWIEDYFFNYWCRKEDALCLSQSIDRIYIPIFWTAYYKRYGQCPHQTIQNFINKNIDPSRKYFTVVQDDDGMLEKTPSNVLVFASGGTGDVPIPLLKKELVVRPKRKDIRVSFVGESSVTHDPKEVRRKTFSTLKSYKGCYFSGRRNMREFVDITSRSVFTLCPRGYGRTSFRLYEAMSLGSIPIYIWDDIEWLPYKDKLNWNEFSISINIKDIEKLPAIIDDHSTQKIRKKIEIIKDLYYEYFSKEGS